jgi:endoglycosylceramidase
MAAALLAGAACSPAAEAPAPVPTTAPGYHVAGGFLRDEGGGAVLLRGMNLAGAHKNAPYFSFHQPPDYVRLHGIWGMNAVRFLISWAAIEPAQGVYDATYLDALERRLSWARDAGLRVVLDMHQDVYGEGFVSGGGNGAPRWSCDAAKYASFTPNPSQWFLNYLSPEVTSCYTQFWDDAALRGHYVEAWRRVARRLAGYEETVVGFDVMNEPYWGSYTITSFEADVLQPFYGDVVAAVRAERPGWVAFLEPASSRNLGIATGLTPFPFGDVVYAPHAYDRDAESGKGFDPAHRAAVLANTAALADEARALGAALWVGEYGGTAAAPGIVDYMTAEYDGFAAAAAGATYWSYDEGGGYSPLDADGAERADLVGALVRPWPERVAGDPVRYAFDPATSTFTLRYRPDAQVAGATILVLPDRVYPHGYTVDCGGCATKAGEDGRLSLTSAPPGDEVTVTVQPK